MTLDSSPLLLFDLFPLDLLFPRLVRDPFIWLHIAWRDGYELQTVDETSCRHVEEKGKGFQVG